jgi:hypothetical protein
VKGIQQASFARHSEYNEGLARRRENLWADRVLESSGPDRQLAGTFWMFFYHVQFWGRTGNCEKASRRSQPLSFLQRREASFPTAPWEHW